MFLVLNTSKKLFSSKATFLKRLKILKRLKSSLILNGILKDSYKKFKKVNKGNEMSS